MKKQRYFVLIELLLALFLATFLLTELFYFKRFASENRRLERQMAKALSLSRVKKKLNRLLDGVNVDHRAQQKGSLFFKTLGGNELMFTYQPPFEMIKELGPVARAHLRVDEKGDLQLYSQSVSSINGGEKSDQKLLLARSVKQLAFQFISSSCVGKNSDQSMSHWSCDFLPQMMLIEVTFSSGEIWAIPHIFSA